jgi:hypothetical protein
MAWVLRGEIGQSGRSRSNMLSLHRKKYKKLRSGRPYAGGSKRGEPRSTKCAEIQAICNFRSGTDAAAARPGRRGRTGALAPECWQPDQEGRRPAHHGRQLDECPPGGGRPSAFWALAAGTLRQNTRQNFREFPGRQREISGRVAAAARPAVGRRDLNRLLTI